MGLARYMMSVNVTAKGGKDVWCYAKIYFVSGLHFCNLQRVGRQSYCASSVSLGHIFVTRKRMGLTRYMMSVNVTRKRGKGCLVLCKNLLCFWVTFL